LHLAANDGKMVSVVEADRQIQKVLQSVRRKWVIVTFMILLLLMNMVRRLIGMKKEAQ